MADQEFVIHIKVDVSNVPGARDTATKALHDIGHEALELNAVLELLHKGFEFLKEAVALPIEQFKELLDVSVELVEVWDKQIVAETKLANVLRATGQEGEGNAERFKKLAESLEDVTRFSDEAILEGQAFALGAGVQADQLERFTRAAVDLAAQLGVGVVDGFQKLNLAVQTGGIRGFKKDISEATDESIRFEEVLRFVESRLHGAAESLARVGAGPLAQLENVFEHFRESLGRIVAESPEFISFVQHVREALTELIHFVDQNRERLTTIFGNVFVASMNLAKKAVEAFAAAAKAAFEGLLDLFLRVADSKVGSLLNLDDGIGSLTRYHQQIEAVKKTTLDLVSAQSSFKDLSSAAIETRKARSNLPPSGFDESRDSLTQTIELQEAGAVRAREIIERLTPLLQQQKETLASLRNEALGISPEGIFSPLVAAADQFAQVAGDGRAELEKIYGLLTAPLARSQGEAAGTIGGLGSDVEQRSLGVGASDGTDHATERFKKFHELFRTFRDEAADSAHVVQNSFDVAVNGMTAAIVEFTTTGQLDFKKFAVSVLADIESILVRQLLITALVGATGGPTGFFGSLLGARAGGGTVLPGRTYIGGERRPEVFTPNEPGRIDPAPSSGGQPMKVSVVNVLDPELVPAALNSREGVAAILNVIRQNRGAIASILP